MGKTQLKKVVINDFAEVHKLLRNQTKNGLPVRRLYFCDCKYSAESYEQLFTHTSCCSHKMPFVFWNKIKVVMPRREIQVIGIEYSALLNDENLSDQLWNITQLFIGPYAVPVSYFKQRFTGIAQWYLDDVNKIEELWNINQR